MSTNYGVVAFTKIADRDRKFLEAHKQQCCELAFEDVSVEQLASWNDRESDSYREGFSARKLGRYNTLIRTEYGQDSVEYQRANTVISGYLAIAANRTTTTKGGTVRKSASYNAVRRLGLVTGDRSMELDWLRTRQKSTEKSHKAHLKRQAKAKADSDANKADTQTTAKPPEPPVTETQTESLEAVAMKQRKEMIMDLVKEGKSLEEIEQYLKLAEL